MMNCNFQIFAHNTWNKLHKQNTLHFVMMKKNIYFASTWNTYIAINLISGCINSRVNEIKNDHLDWNNPISFTHFPSDCRRRSTPTPFLTLPLTHKKKSWQIDWLLQQWIYDKLNNAEKSFIFSTKTVFAKFNSVDTSNVPFHI